MRPGERVVLNLGESVSLKPTPTRDERGRFKAQSAAPLPGSTELQAALSEADEDTLEDYFAGKPHKPAGPSRVIDRAIDLGQAIEKHNNRVTVYTPDPATAAIDKTFGSMKLITPRIHNRYYAVWFVSTLLGMGATAWIVHYFHL